ncbi:hypothetical protein ABNQ38_07770 (plasmid) [Azospirillum sp. A29]|uniref:hypothetical protein n=1 Tax=Azospirillum sp. A29 TaxID=3160606 RepID=UPI00366C14A4
MSQVQFAGGIKNEDGADQRDDQSRRMKSTSSTPAPASPTRRGADLDRPPAAEMPDLRSPSNFASEPGEGHRRGRSRRLKDLVQESIITSAEVDVGRYFSCFGTFDLKSRAYYSSRQARRIEGND